MKVLIVNTSERTGGAAVAAGRLMAALVNNGVQAKMLVMNKQTTNLHVVPAGGRLANKWRFLWERVVIWTTNLFSRQHLFQVSIANTGQDITRLPEFQEADIIHLHWINQGFLSLKDIRKVLHSGKPVVWTMHDMWPATAICHHAYECRRYMEGCGHCPFLRMPSSKDLSACVFRRKLRILQDGGNLTFTAVSTWLARHAKESPLTGQHPVVVIPNSISLSRFKHINRTDARTTLGISEPYVVSFGAARIDDAIKGFSYLIEALRLLVSNGRFAPTDVRMLLFGGIRQPEILRELPVAYTHLGYVSDDDQLSLIYSASNVTVSSSLYETFGQTIIEAMACGSMPVAFDGSGQADIIDHLKTGYLAKRLSAESLAEGIAWGLGADIPVQQLRQCVSSRYAESVVANQYLRLYNSLSKAKDA